jgi:peptide/nickel transport system permease protein
VPVGIYSAARQNSLADRGIAVFLFMLYSLPSFYVGTMLLRYLTVGEPLRWFPTGGVVGEGAADLTALEWMGDAAWHLLLPLICLTYASFAGLSRFARVGIVEVIRSDFVRTARAKGLPERVVILKHTLRNGVIPMLTLMAGILPSLVGGSVIVESIFNLPGVGLLHLESIYSRDWNVIMGIDLLVAVLVLAGILITDVAYAMVDPRITYD